LAEPPAPPVLAEVPVVEPPEPVEAVDPDPDPVDGEAPPVCEVAPPLVLDGLPPALALPVLVPVVLAPVDPDEPEPELDEDDEPDPPPDPLEDEVVSVEVVDVVSVVVVAVVFVCVPAAALLASAAEPLGVVRSGTVRGTASETWVPPQAPRTTPPRRAAARTRVPPGRTLASSRSGPCAVRTWGSR
jgi:hypothetical protein